MEPCTESDDQLLFELSLSIHAVGHIEATLDENIVDSGIDA